MGTKVSCTKLKVIYNIVHGTPMKRTRVTSSVKIASTMKKLHETVAASGRVRIRKNSPFLSAEPVLAAGATSDLFLTSTSDRPLS